MEYVIQFERESLSTHTVKGYRVKMLWGEEKLHPDSKEGRMNRLLDIDGEIMDIVDGEYEVWYVLVNIIITALINYCCLLTISDTNSLCAFGINIDFLDSKMFSIECLYNKLCIENRRFSCKFKLDYNFIPIRKQGKCQNSKVKINKEFLPCNLFIY